MKQTPETKRLTQERTIQEVIYKISHDILQQDAFRILRDFYIKTPDMYCREKIGEVFVIIYTLDIRLKDNSDRHLLFFEINKLANKLNNAVKIEDEQEATIIILKSIIDINISINSLLQKIK